MCTSCPQACMTPGTSEAKSAPVVSVSGRASMSAHSTTVRPSSPPVSVPTTAVSSSRFVGMPQDERNASIRAAVSYSWLPSSGRRWNARRSAASSGAMAVASAK